MVMIIILYSSVIVSGCLWSSEREFLSGEIEILFKEEINETRINEIFNETGLTIKYYPSDTFRGYRVKVPDGKEDEYVQMLQDNYPEIELAKRVLGPIA